MQGSILAAESGLNPLSGYPTGTTRAASWKSRTPQPQLQLRWCPIGKSTRLGLLRMCFSHFFAELPGFLANLCWEAITAASSYVAGPWCLAHGINGYWKEKGGGWSRDRILTGAATVLTDKRESHREPSPKFDVNPRQARPFRKPVFFADDHTSARKRGKCS